MIVFDVGNMPKWVLLIEHFREDPNPERFPRFGLCHNYSPAPAMFWTRREAREYQKLRRTTTHPEGPGCSYRTKVVKLHRIEYTIEIPK